ncbi:hypothetical protein BGW41_003353 [Actinomortierella wolfii]|nr:hypothetical protein BGW41_003353 [Actinomortierella wolfii]
MHDGIIATLASIIILILDLIVLFEILNSNRTVSSKLLWGLLVFFFPLLGIILYFLFANREEHNRAQYEPIV